MAMAETVLDTEALLRAQAPAAWYGDLTFYVTCAGQIRLTFPAPQNNCWSDLGGVNWNNGGLASICSNATAIDSLNSCISGSSCSSDDKQGTTRILVNLFSFIIADLCRYISSTCPNLCQFRQRRVRQSRGYLLCDIRRYCLPN